MAVNTGEFVGEFVDARDRKGNTIPVFQYGEDTIPAIRGNPKEQLPQLKKMEARDDDIVLCAAVKAGTHWLWEIITMLLKGTTEYAAGPKEDAMLEFRPIEELNALPSPRILNTHLRLSNLPEQFIEKKCKFVFVMRNPKDTAVSMYHHFSAEGSAFAYRGSFSDFLSMFMSGVVPHNNWTDYITGWEKDLAMNPDIPYHIIHYENLKQDPVREIKTLASYLDVTCTDDFVDDVVEKCSFRNLKKGKTATPENQRWHFMYRKGEVGDWKNWFTVAENEEFDSYLSKEMNESKFSFRYTL
ncbi:sulfotransferase 1E1-like isoform X3 [Argopecten irradians]|uniref:sulfotransferase 1E1-like isoform X3 n=1 Tax=Argopecten irradians TaxID=31199 RepID=UPI00371E2068